MEFLVAIVTEVGKCLWVPIERRINYLVYYKTNIEYLRNQVEELKLRKIDVQNRVDESHRNLEEPITEVQQWLIKANEIESSTANAGREEIENKRWLKGLCPNWSSRYSESKEAINKAKIIKELLEKGNFSKVSCVLPQPSVIPIPNDYVEGLQPIELAMRQLMEALRNENIRVIGVHGMGGVGKTTLMKRLNNQLQRNQLFEKVIFVTVSSNPVLEEIQNEIAERLGLKLDNDHSLILRASKLSVRLKQEKTVLIILDDVWKILNIFDVGIPSETDHRGCKIVLTSRMESVCLQMGAQKNIKLELLSDCESWILFKAKAGDVVDYPTLQPLANLVMRECKGLPLAIVTVGLSLKMNRDSVIWKDALRKLRSSILNKQDHVFSSLRFSYDFLKDDNIRLCFLFCCLFPEDENIDWRCLYWYGIGEGFLKVDGNLEDALDMVCAFVHRLKDSGLLLDGSNDGHVKMHDVVRDVAIQISKDDGHVFLVKAGLGLEEWPECDDIDEYKRISLTRNKIRELPVKLKCPNLRTLLLQGNGYLKNIPDNLFKEMSSLRVLDLSKTGIVSLPSTMVCLTNLRTLCLDQCPLRDVSRLGGLKKLEILLLEECPIRELPNEICELTNLRLLDLSHTVHLERIPSGVISKLSHLEILEMKDSFSRWDVEENGSGPLARCTEIASLHRLTALEVVFKNDECLFPDMSGPWEKLNRFYIRVGRTSRIYHRRRNRIMSLAMSSPILANWIMMMLGRTEELFLHGCKDVNCLEQLDVVVGSNSLEYLHLQDCDQMECLFNFQNEVQQCAFANLRVLQVERCNKLHKPLFSCGLVGRMQNLEELEVWDCMELQKVFHYDKQQKHKHHRRRRQEEKEDQQQGEGRDYVILPKLRSLFLGHLPNLINIWGGNVTNGCFHNLTWLGIYDCRRLKNLFTLSFARGLQQLHSLRVGGCNDMKELIGNDEEEEELKKEEELEMCKSLFPNLRDLSLNDLLELTCFYTGNVLFDFHSLEDISFSNCPKLKRLPPLGPLPNLQEANFYEEEWFQGLEWDDENTRSKLRSRRRS